MGNRGYGWAVRGHGRPRRSRGSFCPEDRRGAATLWTCSLRCPAGRCPRALPAALRRGPPGRLCPIQLRAGPLRTAASRSAGSHSSGSAAAPSAERVPHRLAAPAARRVRDSTHALGEQQAGRREDQVGGKKKKSRARVRAAPDSHKPPPRRGRAAWTSLKGTRGRTLTPAPASAPWPGLASGAPPCRASSSSRHHVQLEDGQLCLRGRGHLRGGHWSRYQECKIVRPQLGVRLDSKGPAREGWPEGGRSRQGARQDLAGTAQTAATGGGAARHVGAGETR